MKTLHVWTLVFVTATNVVFNFSRLHADNRVNFQIDRLAQSDFKTYVDYILTIWVATGDHNWDVSSFNIGVDYNEAILEDARLWQVNEAIFNSSYDVTITPQPLQNPTWFRFNVLKFTGPLSRIGAGQLHWLARIVLSVKGADVEEFELRVTQEDDVTMDTETGQTVIFNGQDMLRFNTQDESGWGLSDANASQKVAGCNNAFYKFSSCRDFTETFTSVPLFNSVAHWFPEQGSNGYALVRYQYDFDNDNTPDGPGRTYDFDAAALEGIGDDCRCAWQAQTESRFNWAGTTTGGRIYFAKERFEFGGELSARMLAAETHLASADSPAGEALVRIKDSTVCGGEDEKGQSSRIVFNNSDDYYRQFPDLRWTTGAPHGDGPFDCGGRQCMDVRSVIHHELGHYLGLGHSMHPDDLMNGWGSRLNEVHVRFTQCDADRLRRLYSPEIVGDPPVNFSPVKDRNGRDVVLMSSCDIINDVRIDERSLNVNRQSTGLHVLPSPIQSGQEFTIHFTLDRESAVRLGIYDFSGRAIATVAEGVRARGSYAVTVGDLDIPAGLVILRLKTDCDLVDFKAMVLR